MLAIGTSDGIVMLESKNAAWEVAERALPGARVEGVCSTGSGTIVATDQGIFESSGSTGGWRKTLDGVDARSLAVTTDGIVFVGANNAMLYRRRPSEEHFTEVTSFRELPTCASWTFPVAPHLPNIRAMVASPTAPGRVYVGVEVGGIMLTEDGGETWREVRESIHPDVHGLAAAPGSDDQIFAVTGVGFYRSLNGAQTWESRCEGLKSMYTIAVANDPNQPERLFASATNSRPRYWRSRPEGAVARVYRSDDGGSLWEPLMSDGLVNAIEALAVDGEGTVFAGTDGGQVLMRSSDSDSWEVAAEGLAPINSVTAL